MPPLSPAILTVRRLTPSAGRAAVPYAARGATTPCDAAFARRARIVAAMQAGHAARALGAGDAGGAPSILGSLGDWEAALLVGRAGINAATGAGTAVRSGGR